MGYGIFTLKALKTQRFCGGWQAEKVPRLQTPRYKNSEKGAEFVTDTSGRELPGLDTFPGLLLTLTALSGELPTA